MEWTEETIVRLRALWAEGLSTAEIGRRLGASKNAVVGKAHRLELPARPSPIRRDPTGAGRAPQPRRISGPTLPSFASATSATVDSGLPDPLPAAAQAVQQSVASRPEPRPAPLRLVAPRPARSMACCWPLGEPGTPSFRFCGDDALPSKPYCDAHAQLAYVRVRDRREDAA